MKRIAQILIRLYQGTISTVIPHYCRFQPTCSYYAYEAIMQYGFIKGSWLTVKRLGHCHPFSRGGYDPVPKTVVKKTI